MAARYGGDEFVILFPNNVDTLLAVADARMYEDKEAKSGYQKSGV